jgi:hypothetical protein
VSNTNAFNPSRGWACTARTPMAATQPVYAVRNHCRRPKLIQPTPCCLKSRSALSSRDCNQYTAWIRALAHAESSLLHRRAAIPTAARQ